MRVGLVTPYSWTVPGGVNHHIEHLAEELEHRGHEAWIIAPVGALTLRRRSVDSARHPFAERFIPVGTALPVPSNGSRAYLAFSPRTVTRVDRTIRHGRFDVLHVHEPATPAVSMAAVMLSTCPVVGTFHAALDSSRGYDDWAWLMRLIMERIDVRIAVSEAAQAFPASRYPGDYRIIPNGIPVERFEVCQGKPKVDGRILFIGRAERRKGLDVLVKAFPLVRRRLPHATLVIAGATRRDVLEAVRGARTPPDLDGIEPLGWVDDKDKLAQLGAAQVVCAPSLTAESFGIVLVEAMAGGVPVVASDLPGYRSVLRDGAVGRLVPPGEPAALAAALVDLLQDEPARTRFAAAGKAVAADLSWVHVSDSIINAYEDALTTPFDRGRHGFPDRPWFGRALLDYIVWSMNGGQDGTDPANGNGAHAGNGAGAAASSTSGSTEAEQPAADALQRPAGPRPQRRS
jgi:phosphatidyl-myo-inositol alpha-mannosyltransferase